MAIRRTTARLSLASAVAAAAISLATAPLPAAADDAAPFVPRVPMGVTMIRALVSEHDGAAMPTTVRVAGAAGVADDKAAFDESKLIRLGDVDDNGAADYAYVSNSALHMFLFDTDGAVTSHRAVMLNSLAGEPAKEAEKETPATQVRKVLKASTKMAAAAADKVAKAATPSGEGEGDKATPAKLAPVSHAAEADKAERPADAKVDEPAKADAAGADDDLSGAEAAASRRKLSSVPAVERTSMRSDAMVVRQSTDGCLFSTTECECDLKSAVTGSGTCFSHERTVDGVAICTERDCSPSYVCMCGGSQKCARTTETVMAWGSAPPSSSGPPLAAGESYCTKASTTQAVTNVVGPMPTPQPTPPPAGCVLNGTQCTCALKSTVGGVETCSSHDGVDGAGRNVCTTRKCMDSYVCDCAGSSVCEHHDVTNEFWGLGGAAGGGKFYCDMASKTTTVATCISNC
ncbi:hypothetical protein BU14_0209s0020 [Porphyra umbilicalis]|uniref:Uncharacterized protein n=1 Tax=Porphyra umbilicalis TaxID=2786 RepID=A0A1X6P5A7_PORUM|nr:hypothetical protein BU14_0209s0020 [Porphyra umbilicalis]|eukprot:OSX76028.1 hypothetical protein BU14_0209s0020 [Porphyra umbilicalis]